MAPAPVTVKNRFAALSERNIVDSHGAVLDTAEDYKLSLFMKPSVKQKKPSKTRRGEARNSSSATSACAPP